MALQPFVGPWPLLQFRYLFTQSVGLLGQVISPSQGRYLHTGQHKHRINAGTDIHALSGIWTHDPSVRARDRTATVIGSLLTQSAELPTQDKGSNWAPILFLFFYGGCWSMVVQETWSNVPSQSIPFLECVGEFVESYVRVKGLELWF
jgi:hypothetical protein